MTGSGQPGKSEREGAGLVGRPTASVPLAAPPAAPCPGWSGAGDDGPWVWVKAHDDWHAGGGPYTCRAKGCLRPAVMRLNRWQHRRGKGRVPMWWHYCAEHSYGRVVHDGAVWQPGRPEGWDGSQPEPTYASVTETATSAPSRPDSGAS